MAIWSWWSETLRDPTRVVLVAGWFTGGAALVGVVVSAIVSTIVSQRSVYINAVKVETSKWMEALRGKISRYHLRSRLDVQRQHRHRRLG